jgi:hypothetical protein
MKPNPSRISVALDLLSEIGFKKPFLASGRQFVIDSFLTYPSACDQLLTYCYLVGARDHSDRLHLWDGFGRYKAWCKVVPEFRGDEPVIFLVNIAPIWHSPIDSMKSFSDLLEPQRDTHDETAAAISSSGKYPVAREVLSDQMLFDAEMPLSLEELAEQVKRLVANRPEEDRSP